MKRHLHTEIEDLKKRILALSARVEENVLRAVKSIEARDPQTADEVISSDVQIDHLEVEMEEECLKILALHQPVANDLRFIISVLKINNDLERIGDLAVNIAERVDTLISCGDVSVPFDLFGMAEKARRMLSKSLDALVNMNSDLAVEVRNSDDEVDDLHAKMFKVVKRTILENPNHIDGLIGLLTVSHNLERVADHATNIAEDIIYMIEGNIVRHRQRS